MKRIAVVDYSLCNPKKCNFACIKVCPRNKLNEKCIYFEDNKIHIEESICIGCNICVKKCPFEAIKIVNLPLEEGKEIFRYGKNGFALYSLPLPQKGKIRGILGGNGIGKSTSLKILAGKLLPIKDNLPRLAKVYLEKKRKISYKPQILEEVKKEEIKKEFFKLLELKDNEEKSGGELQKWNIAKCLSKEAELYIIDEPSSYLDIKERLRIAKILRQFLKDKEVIVVDHDLCFLDYVADELFIFFGEKGVYGFSSDVYSISRGINSFLEGFLKNENIRLRKEPLKFRKLATQSLEGEPLLSYTYLRKSFDSFVLEIEGGEIKSRIVTGIVGRNSIGKTTFAKLLAGILKPDEGKIDKKIKIAYKPQYLHSEDEVKVSEILPKDKEFRDKICFPLGIDRKILEKKLKELSGGELQVVAIALCLSKEAELYLLDEPSAFLDVEQRVNLSSLLQKISEEKGKSILVIDHDLFFMDYLSKEIILFDGISNKHGKALPPKEKKLALNEFLRSLGITVRRDKETFRPKINKEGSVLDKKQKEKGIYFEDI